MYIWKNANHRKNISQYSIRPLFIPIFDLEIFVCIKRLFEKTDRRRRRLWRVFSWVPFDRRSLSLSLYFFIISLFFIENIFYEYSRTCFIANKYLWIWKQCFFSVGNNRSWDKLRRLIDRLHGFLTYLFVFENKLLHVFLSLIYSFFSSIIVF